MNKTYDFNCEVPNCGFQSEGWPTQELADLRGSEHMQEHEDGEPMRELDEFRKEEGVEV